MKKVKMFGKMIPVFVLVLLGIGIVSGALLTYFGVIRQTVTVNQAVVLFGGGCVGNVCDETATMSGGETVISTQYGLQSQTSVEVPVTLVTTVNPDESGITSKIVGTLELTKKTVDFGNPVWAVLGDKVQIEYIIVGDEFNAEVTSGAKDGYVLVYYADNDDRFANPGQAVLVGDVSGDLPAVGDFNIVNDYSAEYPTTPFGAKIWYVPMDALTLNGGYDIAWGRASEFYFESSLIQYNTDGEITIYPGEVLDFQVETTFSTANTGIYTVRTEVQV